MNTIEELIDADWKLFVSGNCLLGNLIVCALQSIHPIAFI